MKKFIAHIVPCMDIGGVEVAIYRSYQELNLEFDYRVFYVRRKGTLHCGQEPVWKLFYYLIFRGQRINVAITSLWWAHPFGWLLQISGASWVTFFHSSNYFHILDKVFLRWAWRNSSYRLVDSAATSATMSLNTIQAASLVPYVFPIRQSVVPWKARDVDFIWTGRAAAVKRIDLLISFLSLAENYFGCGRVIVAIAGQVPDALTKFTQVSRWTIEIKQNLPNEDVLIALSRAKFYLLFSDHEGMSMSTVEAIQAGCIAVVRRVGEIPRYLDKSACISVSDDLLGTLKDVALSTFAISQDLHAINAMQTSASNSISKIPFYTNSILIAIRSVLKLR